MTPCRSKQIQSLTKVLHEYLCEKLRLPVLNVVMYENAFGAHDIAVHLLSLKDMPVRSVKSTCNLMWRKNAEEVRQALRECADSLNQEYLKLCSS